MIVSNTANLFGKIAVIHAPTFNCVIVTAKEGLFKKESTVITKGDYIEDKSNSFPCAKIFFGSSLKSSERYHLHDMIANRLNTLSDEGVSLKAAIDTCFQDLKEDGFAAETINLLAEEESVYNSPENIEVQPTAALSHKCLLFVYGPERYYIHTLLDEEIEKCYGKEVSIVHIDSPVEAFNYLIENNVDLVISDSFFYKDKTGMQLLNACKTLYPLYPL